jgi:hypothetical protein
VVGGGIDRLSVHEMLVALAAGGHMPTLHIEHQISDLANWVQAFTGFGDARANAGVTGQRVHQPADDDRYIYVELDFDTSMLPHRSKNFSKQLSGRRRTTRLD